MFNKQTPLKLSAIAISILLASCGGGGSDGYYNQNENTTGGGSGSPKSFNIHLGERKFTLNIATWKMRRNNGSPLENIGIEPDLPVITTPDDVIQYQDPDLKKAIEYVHSHLEI